MGGIQDEKSVGFFGHNKEKDIAFIDLPLTIREIYCQTQRGSSEDSLIIKNFYSRYRIVEQRTKFGDQRTEFHQICQERYQGQT